MTSPLLAMKTYATFDGSRNMNSLSELCIELLSEQKKTWPDLGKGYESLEGVRAREIVCSGFAVRVQHNPGRMKSTMADVGETSINSRPCFLCLNNLPEGQKGIFYREEYLILCNPMPVFSGHLTVSHHIHQPQSIVEHVDALVQLMSDFGSSWIILYNGPQCGASAPDHLHFQAIPSGRMPIEKEILAVERLTPIVWTGGVSVSRAQGLGREVIVLEGDERKAVAVALVRIVVALKEACDANNEPMMNLAGFHDGEKWSIIVFPRAKHRPEAYFKEGDARIVVSPGVVEMGGVLVTPMGKDFERLDAASVEGIFLEVSLSEEVIERAISAAAKVP